MQRNYLGLCILHVLEVVLTINDSGMGASFDLLAGLGLTPGKSPEGLMRTFVSTFF